MRLPAPEKVTDALFGTDPADEGGEEEGEEEELEGVPVMLVMEFDGVLTVGTILPEVEVKPGEEDKELSGDDLAPIFMRSADGQKFINFITFWLT